MKVQRLIGLVCVAALLLAAPAAQGAMSKLGTATGGVMIYYNNIDNSGAAGVPDGIISGYDENAANQAYTLYQNSYSNTNGMSFQFDDTDLGMGQSWNDIFSGQPVGSSQFGFDLLAYAPTYNPAGGVILPTMSFADNVDNTVAGAALTPAVPPSFIAWAINDYKEPSGPAAGGSIINSIFRGTGVAITSQNLTYANNIYTLTVEGTFDSDGLIHWYNPAFGSTALSSWNLEDKLYYKGVFSYDSTGDVGADQRDFYAGSMDVYVNVIPAPGAVALGSMGVGLVGWLRRRRSL